MTHATTTRPPFAAPRAACAALGATALAAAVVLLGPWALALWLLPDLALLVGGRSAFTGDGRLAPRAVPVYNALHALPGPVALTAVGAVLGGPVLGLGVLWISHVLLDRAMGYGLRAADGGQRA